jgi:maltooligosyltrehalose trehalohydrolase
MGYRPAAMKGLGVTPVRGRGWSARVWAPTVCSVAVVPTGTGARHELAATEDGFFADDLPLRPGDDYRFQLDDGTSWPDPCSGFQSKGVDGPSHVVDTAALRPPPWKGLNLDDLVLYELHLDTFTAESTFDAVIEHLQYLRDLGVTAVELMPVATSPGNRGWGYDGVHTWAPHVAYGGPEGVARLVAAAHDLGLGCTSLSPASGTATAASSTAPWPASRASSSGRRAPGS